MVYGACFSGVSQVSRKKGIELNEKWTGESLACCGLTAFCAKAANADIVSIQHITRFPIRIHNMWHTLFAALV
jgi:hypothetical protein